MALTQISTDGIKNGTITGSDLATSFATTGDFTLTGANYNVLWDKSDSALEFADNAQALFGTGADLRIYHNGTHSFIQDAGTGNLEISSSKVAINNAANNANMGTFTDGGAVALYHNGSKKFETTSSGVAVTGQLTIPDGSPTGNRIAIGDSQDLALYHNSSNSFLVDRGTGPLYIRGNNAVRIEKYVNDSAGEPMIIANADGAVDLYYNNSKKFETTSTGATLTGTLIADGLTLYDNEKLLIGTNTDIEIFHNGTNSIFQSDTGDLQINSGNSAGNVEINLNNNVAGDTRETSAKFIKNGAVELYYDNSKKFYTISTGAYVEGFLLAADNGGLKLGSGNDLQIFHDGSHSRVYNYTGNLAIDVANDIQLRVASVSSPEMGVDIHANGSVDLYYDGSKKFETTSSGVTVTGTINFGSGMGSGLNSNGFNINFADSDGSQDMAKFGDSGDLKIYHDSANSYIQNLTGALRIYNHVLDVRNDTGNETILKGSANGSVELYHNNVKKLETTSVGVTMNDTVITNGEIRPASDNDHSIGRSNRRYITYFGVNSPVNTSDKNEKNTIIDSDLGLDFINKLKPISYKWNKDDGKTHYGLIAQDLEETLTSLGKTIADFGGIYKEDDSPMGLGYSELIAPLIKAVQELSTEVAALKAS